MHGIVSNKFFTIAQKNAKNVKNDSMAPGARRNENLYLYPCAFNAKRMPSRQPTSQTESYFNPTDHTFKYYYGLSVELQVIVKKA